jgi:hypothetical protein
MGFGIDGSPQRPIGPEIASDMANREREMIANDRMGIPRIGLHRSDLERNLTTIVKIPRNAKVELVGNQENSTEEKLGQTALRPRLRDKSCKLQAKKARYDRSVSLASDYSALAR